MEPGDGDAVPAGLATPHTLSVSAIVSFLKQLIEGSDVLSDIWVQGEISNYSRSSLGHRYFSLKDERSVLKSVLFSRSMPGVELHEGDRVFARGSVGVYLQRGELQFVCTFVRPEGVGILAAKYEELKRRLEEEGLFDTGRKRPLPRFPLRIGVVTSPVGAALQDIRNVLSRRWPLATLILAPALVQGGNAAPQIVAALKSLANEPGLDLAIVARGGGSAEDLWAFNDERVARAIFGFPVPVVSGVGHETDETITDLVADLRAPTPSAAAERSSPDHVQMGRALVALSRSMAAAARAKIADNAAATEAATVRLQRGAPDVAGCRRELAATVRNMQTALERRCSADRARFEHANARIAALDPMATLRRGFAIVQKAGGRQPVVVSTRKVKAGDRLSVSVADGAFWTEVS